MSPDFDPAPIKLVVFDFDGVILESAHIKTEAFPDLFADYPQHQAAIRAYHLAHQGVSRYAKFEWIYANLLREALSEQRSQALGERFSELVLEKVMAAPFVPGARDLLDSLQGRMTLAVASGTPETELRGIVERREIGRYFSDVCGAPRTKTEILRSLMVRHDCDSRQTLMIGDANTDYEAARTVGCAFYARIAVDAEPHWDSKTACGGPDLRALVAAFRSAARSS